MKTEASDNFSQSDWISKFLEAVRTNAHAYRSLRTLTEAGIDPRLLFFLLPLSCEIPSDPLQKIIIELRSAFLSTVKEASKLADRLDADRSALTGFASFCSDGLLQQMNETAATLRSSAAAMIKFSKHYKLDNTFFLALLISSVKEKTGSPRYREISNLMDCAYAAYGLEGPPRGEEALGRAYRRFKKENPLGPWATPAGMVKLLDKTLILWIIALVKSGKVSVTQLESILAGQKSDIS